MTMAEARVQTIAAPRCELGEGPHYDRDGDRAWWFDIVGRKLYEHHFADNRTQAHTLPRMGSVLAAVDAERQLLVLEDGLYLRRKEDGSLTLLHPLEAENARTRSNDGRVHPSGRLWIGTMGKKAEREVGAIYWFDGRELRRLYDKVSIPNSICFSPDGSVGYFADTALNRVWRVALDPASGLPRGEPETFLEGEALPLGGAFDGSVVDAEGVLWNAAWGAGSVSGFLPDGSLLRTFEAPAAQTSCPCFVGARLDRMLVTTAWEGYSQAQREADPGAGFTYVIEGAFKGMADCTFLLPPATDNG